METVYILLPVHNRCEITRRFVTCLMSQTYQNYHLVLIDDGSTDGTREMVSAEISALTVISGQGDWWWAGALQQGYEWLRRQSLDSSDLVLIINDDTEFEANFLEYAVGLCHEQKGALLLAQSFSRETGQLVGGGVRVDWSRLQFAAATAEEEINGLSTRGLFMSVDDFVDLGGFYPRILPHYLSDYEFTIRAYRRGMRLWVDKDLKLWVNEQTTGFHHFGEETFREFFGKYFAKKSDANPFAWTVFIALACPWQWKLISWMRVWYGTVVNGLKVLLN